MSPHPFLPPPFSAYYLESHLQFNNTASMCWSTAHIESTDAHVTACAWCCPRSGENTVSLSMHFSAIWSCGGTTHKCTHYSCSLFSFDDLFVWSLIGGETSVQFFACQGRLCFICDVFEWQLIHQSWVVMGWWQTAIFYCVKI